VIHREGNPFDQFLVGFDAIVSGGEGIVDALEHE
jgi:hypothetical protein